MKYTSKAHVIAAAAVGGSTATTFAGARRWILAHTKSLPLDARGRHWARCGTRAQYERNAWVTRIERRADAAAQALGYWSLADAEALAMELTGPYLAHASRAVANAWPYRRSTSSWAGGNHTVCVRLTEQSQSLCYAACESKRVWSDNGKWSGSDSAATISTDLETLRLFPTLMADGLVLCRARQISAREYEVRWFEQSTGVRIKPVDGWLIRGVHVTAKTLIAARRKAAAARRAQVTALRTKRVSRANLRRVYVDYDDSIAAGNCVGATTTGARAIWQRLETAGPCAVRADVLLGIRSDNYANKAIGAAIARYARA
jgi:hypothetical protein